MSDFDFVLLDAEEVFGLSGVTLDPGGVVVDVEGFDLEIDSELFADAAPSATLSSSLSGSLAVGVVEGVAFVGAEATGVRPVEVVGIGTQAFASFDGAGLDGGIF